MGGETRREQLAGLPTGLQMLGGPVGTAADGYSIAALVSGADDF